MAEYIEKETMRGIIRDEESKHRLKGCAWIEIAMDRQPAADVAPVRHGRWIKRGYVCGDNEYECSACHETEWRTSAIRLKYCPYCGARMDGGGDG